MLGEPSVSLWGQCGAHVNKGFDVSIAPLYKDGFVSNTAPKPLGSSLHLSDRILVTHASGSMDTDMDHDVLV